MDMNIEKYNNILPSIDEDVFIANGANIIGDVSIEKDSSIWFNVVIRGDVAPVIIGQGTNIQDCSVIHSSRFNGPSNIGDFVTVGHSAVIHACTIHDYGFIGMHSTVMDKAIIESYGFVAAGALIPPGKIVKSHELWAGVPGKFIRKITSDEINLIEDSFQHYIKLSQQYK